MLMVLLLAVVIAVRVGLLDVPLERAEGEYAYMGQLLLKGKYGALSYPLNNV